ncbi:MAG TPA: histone deacetylase [Solirubrobacteraceae bacterium]|nr:histone deacetylase [Solirubrobacteraceae bacterium]
MGSDLRRTGLYFSHPSSFEHDPRELMPGHPDIPERLRAIDAVLAGEDWLGWERRESPAASVRELELIHDAEHVQRIERLALAGGGAADLDTVVGAASWRAALHAAGGACEVTRSLRTGERSLACSVARPPGHHAEADRAMGFCLFNNAAIAAELAIREYGAARVLLLDWDVHHGNGSAESFRSRDDVLYASIHQGNFYPGTGPLQDVGSGSGEGFTINLPVPAGSGEELWLSLLARVIVPAAREFAPELVLISAGFDAHRADPLGECMLEDRSFAEMARHVRDLASECKAPVGVILEGGYEPAALAVSLREALLALGDDRPPRALGEEDPLTARAVAHIGRWWSL